MSNARGRRRLRRAARRSPVQITPFMVKRFTRLAQEKYAEAFRRAAETEAKLDDLLGPMPQWAIETDAKALRRLESPLRLVPCGDGDD